MIDGYKKRRGGYLRFRYSRIPSISWMYSNPFSISVVASLMLVAVLHVYSSFSVVSSSWVYLSVVLRSLCPSAVFTSSRSLVLKASGAKRHEQRFE